MAKDKPIIVLSAINFFTGGPLSILKAAVNKLVSDYAQNYRIMVLVHDLNLLSVDHRNIEIIEFPKSRRSYLYRLYYEYIYFWFFSKRLKPYLWLSLHDMSPNVVATKKAVYCHNSSPFYKASVSEKNLSPSFSFFNKFYGYLYGINIKKNDAVIVQQEWLRDAFQRRYGVERVIVAHPGSSETKVIADKPDNNEIRTTHFIYPSLSRVFKNFEVIGQAVRILEGKGMTDFKVSITLDGSEDAYANHIKSSYGDLKCLHFIGLQNKHQMQTLYQHAHCLIFPSKLETWGLPITEAKDYHLPILLVDLPYAHETLGSYDRVKFFNKDDPQQLAHLMEQKVAGNLEMDSTFAKARQQPFAANWEELFKLLIS